MIGPLLFALAVSLVTTLILEAGFFLLIGKRNRKDLLLLALVNVITNPVVVLTYWLAYADINRYALMSVLEVFAVLTEGYFYRKYGQDFRRPYLFSIAVNAFSFGIGLLVQQFI